MGKNEIKTEGEYRQAVSRYLDIFDAPETSAERAEAILLSIQMEDYEDSQLAEAEENIRVADANVE